VSDKTALTGLELEHSTFFHIGHTKGQDGFGRHQKLESGILKIDQKLMSNILDHKGNAHQNYTENPPHPSQNGYH
jgi:hypothetical protein